MDDHFAKALATPGPGELPLWLPLILSLAFSFSLDGAFVRAARTR